MTIRYAKITNNLWLEYDDATDSAVQLKRAKMTNDLADAEARLAELPDVPTDAKLLKWARANYPQMDYAAERAELTARIALLTARLAATV
jgi:hypothetical protein